MASEKKIRLFIPSILNDSKSDNITNIEKLGKLSLDEEHHIKNPQELSEQDLANAIGDIDISTEERIQLLDFYSQKYNENLIEITNKLNTMYLFSRTKFLEDFLYHIVMKSKIDPFLKIETAKILTTYSERGYECLEFSLKNFTIPTPIRLECIYILLSQTSTKENAINFFKSLLIDQTIECLFRYKSILNLEIHFSENKTLYHELSTIAVKTFLECPQNMTYYRILACQYFYNKCNQKENIELKEQTIEYLFKFALDEELDYNIRADAVDVLMRYDNPDIVKRANQILLDLGSNGRTVRSIFDNSQNVHQHSIEDSSQKIIDFLITIPLVKKGISIHYDKIRDEIKEMIMLYRSDYIRKIEIALTRIFIDRALYGKSMVSLGTIFLHLWAYIIDHEFSQELKKRLIEELYDSSEVCSTGYAHRMVNVLSGYTDMSISISFEEQISANLQGRLNAIIREIVDTDYQSLIINEMLISINLFHLRGNFLKFFRDHISKIREEMYQEFREFMEDTDYDLYFRKAIMSYEGTN